METTTIIRIVAGLLAIFVALPVFIIPYWKIFSNAGFAGALSLLMIIPLINLIVLYVIAFSDWKMKPGKASIV